MPKTTIPNLLKTAKKSEEKGNFLLAEQLCQQVLARSPNNLQALLYLATLALRVERSDVAIPLLVKANSIKNDDPNILYNLGLANQQGNLIESAIHYYTLAIKLNPRFSLAYNNLGVAYQHLGKISLANKSFKKAIHFTPNFINAYFNYSQSYRYSENDSERTEHLKTLLHEKILSLDEKIKLNFTLGKIHDDLKIYGIAFEYYKSGNNLKDQGFNAPQYQQYIDKIIKNFDHGNIKKPHFSPERKNTDKRLIFIIGMPRSGSTLVEQIINKHSAACSAGETGFIGEIVDELSHLIDSQQPYPDCIKDMSSKKLLSITASLQAYLHNLPHSYHVIVEKSPINFLHIGLILSLLPDSIIIHTNRNPISTCLSCYFQNFNQQHQYSYDLRNLAFFHNEYTRLMKHWASVFPNNIFNIEYESLVENQLEESKKIISACGLTWEEKCLSFYDTVSVVGTASKWQVRKPIYKTSVDKWKHYEPYLSDLITSLK